MQTEIPRKTPEDTVALTYEFDRPGEMIQWPGSQRRIPAASITHKTWISRQKGLNIRVLLSLLRKSMTRSANHCCSGSFVRSLTCQTSSTFPSGSSQCTSPEHPVSCIQPGLAIHFTYDIIHVSMLFSHIIPPSPSPTESGMTHVT